MTAFILLIICLFAQIIIAVSLGIYLFRRHLREKRGNHPTSSGNPKGESRP